MCVHVNVFVVLLIEVEVTFTKYLLLGRVPFVEFNWIRAAALPFSFSLQLFSAKLQQSMGRCRFLIEDPGSNRFQSDID